MLESYKVVFLGEESVGKPEIIKTFVYGISSDNSNKLLNHIKKTITLEGDKSITFDLFDTPGQEVYRPVAKKACEKAKVIIFVYDITNKKTFDEIKNYWYEEIKQSIVESEIIYAVVGNRCDLYNNQEVSNGDAKEFAKSINAIFALTSNKSTDGVQTLFENIAKRILEKEKGKDKKDLGEKQVEKEDEKNINKNKQKEKCVIC